MTETRESKVRCNFLIVEDRKLTLDVAAEHIRNLLMVDEDDDTLQDKKRVHKASCIRQAIAVMEDRADIKFVFLDGLLPYSTDPDETHTIEKTLEFMEMYLLKFPEVVFIAFSAENNHILIEHAHRLGREILACDQKDVRRVAERLIASYNLVDYSAVDPKLLSKRMKAFSKP